MTTSKLLPHRSQLSACQYRNEPLPVSALIKLSPSIVPNRVTSSVAAHCKRAFLYSLKHFLFLKFPPQER